MEFKVRPDTDKNPKGYRSYLMNLKAEASSLPSALLEYFSIDFFSDGEIKNCVFSNDMKTFSFEVSSPNIMKLNGENDFSYVSPVWFEVVFDKVALFSLETTKLDKSNNPFGKREMAVVFLASEVDGMQKEIKQAEKSHGGKFHSLTIKTIPMNRSLSLVFSGIRVQPKKPSVLSALKKSKVIRFPRLNSAIKGDAYKA